MARTVPTISQWSRHRIEDRILDILSEAPLDHRGSGRAFMTVYQIAIEFRNRFPTEFSAVADSVGGEGEGHRSLTRYLSKELVDRIRDGSLTRIQFAFLSSAHIERLDFV